MVVDLLARVPVAHAVHTLLLRDRALSLGFSFEIPARRRGNFKHMRKHKTYSTTHLILAAASAFVFSSRTYFDISSRHSAVAAWQVSMVLSSGSKWPTSRVCEAVNSFKQLLHFTFLLPCLSLLWTS